ncbi:MAG: transposase [Spirochaetales bacterium]|nr:transposase [Spirochaetales bacterium]
MTHRQAKAIMECRTALGGHVDFCPDCGYERNSYNSCRNRHCPKCQTLKKEQWIGKRCEDILDVRHFHAVFTIPSELNQIVMQNPATLYRILFKTTADTIRELASDPNYLGIVPGFTSILHTWGQNLSFHPHVHMVITGGGMIPEDKWKSAGKKFFLPVKVLSRLFRGKFLSELIKLYDNGSVIYRGKNGNKVSHQTFNNLMTTCYAKDWCVYCKKPFKGTNGVFAYLGRYTHRVAISNNRILKVKNGITRFSRYKAMKYWGKRCE